MTSNRAMNMQKKWLAKNHQHEFFPIEIGWGFVFLACRCGAYRSVPSFSMADYDENKSNTMRRDLRIQDSGSVGGPFPATMQEASTNNQKGVYAPELGRNISAGNRQKRDPANPIAGLYPVLCPKCKEEIELSASPDMNYAAVYSHFLIKHPKELRIAEKAVKEERKKQL